MIGPDENHKENGLSIRRSALVLSLTAMSSLVAMEGKERHTLCYLCC